MQFKVELLTKNISITKFDELIHKSEIINVIPDGRVKIDDKYVQVNYSAKYKSSFEGNNFAIHTQQLPSGIVKISLIQKYSTNKFSSAKKFDKFISRFTEFLGRNYLKHSELSNDLSSYFAQRLYPKFQKYESALRKIFVLALSPLEDENIVKIIKEKTNDRLDLSQIHTVKYIENLQIAELHTLIFEFNLNRIDNLPEHFKDFQNKSESDLRKMINSTLPITIWERHFLAFAHSDKSGTLKNNYDEIRKYRNDVMHFHRITYRRYQKIVSLLSDASTELEVLENSMLRNWDFESTRKLVNDISNQDFVAGVSNLSKTVAMSMDRFYTNNVNLNSVLKSMVDAFKNIQLPKISPEVLKAIQSLSTTIGQLGMPNNFYENGYEEED